MTNGFKKFLPIAAIFGLAGGIILSLGGFPKKVAAEPISAPDLTNIVDEVMSVGEFYRSPEPNPGQTELVFMRSGDGKRRIWKADIQGNAVQLLSHKPEARRLFSWSPDGRYLLFLDENQGSWLRLYDAKDGSFKRAAKEPNGPVSQAVWLDATQFVYISKPNEWAEIRLVRLDEKHEVLRKIPNPGTMDWMAVLSEKKIAYIEEREIWTFDLESRQATQMTTNVAEQLLWLNYSRQNQEFLYCSIDDSDWRHLFKISLKPETYAKVTQLTFGPDHTYNGQWIQNGAGFAYVGNLTNHFYLAVRPVDSVSSTNLFFGGNVLAYRVSEDGQKIYAAAATGQEPPGIWEYDISAKALRCIVPGSDGPLKYSEIIPRTEHWVKSFDDLQVPFYMQEPRRIKKDRKYPVVIAIPPDNGQFVNAWEKYSQFFANIGTFFVAVNPRGSDGYGRTYMKIDSKDAYEDIEAVRQWVLKNPNVDSERVFLFAYCNGGLVANQLAAFQPESWEGVILISSAGPRLQSASSKLPRYLLFVGEKEEKPRLQRVKEFKKWADDNNVQATLLLDKNTFHHITDVNVDKKIGFAIAEFIFGQSQGAIAGNSNN